MKQTNKTTLSILVPEAEKTIGTFRLKYAPSAALGMPAHVTVLHPFKLSTEISEELKDDLRAIISSHPIFNFSLSSIERFPNVLYLKPTPCRPLRELTKSIASHYPETPPYEGKIVDPIPHLTIAKSEDTHLLDHLFGEVSVALEGCMPIQATARQIWLLEQKGEVWQKHTVFSLRPT